MIDLACGMIQIENKCSCLEIFNQQGNLNLILLDVIPYHLALELSIELVLYQNKRTIRGLAFDSFTSFFNGLIINHSIELITENFVKEFL